MTQTTIVQVDGAQGTVHAKAREGRRLRWHHFWLVPGLAIAILANQLGNVNGVGILALIAFGIAPDVPRLLGSRGRPVHALLHQPVVPAMAVAIAATGVVPVAWLVASLVWFSHVVIGRAVGDVPRRAAPRSGGTFARRPGRDVIAGRYRP
jgi:hypothetical protein